MVKSITKRSFHGAYRRRHGASLFVRDRFGRCETYRLVGGRPKKHGKGILKLAPVYGRVNFANGVRFTGRRSEEHTSELQSRENIVCRLLLEKKNNRAEHRALLPA